MIHLHPHLFMECILTILMSFLPQDILYTHYIHSRHPGHFKLANLIGILKWMNELEYITLLENLPKPRKQIWQTNKKYTK